MHTDNRCAAAVSNPCKSHKLCTVLWFLAAISAAAVTACDRSRGRLASVRASAGRARSVARRQRRRTGLPHDRPHQRAAAGRWRALVAGVDTRLISPISLACSNDAENINDFKW